MKKTVIQIVVFLLLSLCVNAQRPLAYRILTVNDAYRVILDRYPEIERFDIYYSIVHGMLPMSGIPVNDNWVFFVDEEPQKGWSHNCTLYTVPRTVDDRLELTDIPIHSESLTMPPSQYNLSPYIIGNSLRNNASMQIRVHGNHETYNGDSIANEAAEHTYAMILSGGYNKYSNYGRYWNDCSYIYQTLRNKYGIPKDNITLLMADGDNPAADMIKTDWTGYQSSPLDLDFDSIADLHLAATKVNVDSVLTSYAESLTGDDHLFIYVIDHGSNDNAGNSIICLWNQQYLKDYELAAKLDSINVRSINVLLGQCYSGGFVEELEANGRVIATACSGTESSWACPDIPYDEFVYQWTNAINEMDKDSVILASDKDDNGRVTMHEAFIWARKRDRRNETPQYSSTPISVGEDLAFNNIPDAVDLYIRDNTLDTGKEPNTTTRNIFCSPDVYVRNQHDGLEVHICEQIDTTLNHQLFVYAIVRNRGTEDYTSNNKYVHFYWAAPGLFFNPVSLHENTVDICADYIGHARIGRVNAGDSTIVYSQFSIPEYIYEDHHDLLESGNISLIALICDQQYPSNDDLEGIIKGGKQWVRNNNNLAVRNLYKVKIRTKHDFDLCCQLDSARYSIKFYKDSLYYMEKLYIKSDLLSDSIHLTPAHHLINMVQSDENDGWLRLDGDSCAAENLLITPESNTNFSIKIENEGNSIDSIPDYNIDVYLQDAETNEIIGGMTLHVIHGEDGEEPETQQVSTSNPVIDKVSINENSIVHVELLEPLEEDAVALIKTGDDTSAIKTIQLRKGISCFDAKVKNRQSNLIFVSIEKNGKIIDSKKTFFLR